MNLSSLLDDEFIYRRIPVSKGFADAYPGEIVDPEAFWPRRPNPKVAGDEGDNTGLSVSREWSAENPDFLPLHEIAKGPSKQGYQLAKLRVGDLRQKGLNVVPRPLADNPGHAEIESITCLLDRTEIDRLARLCSEAVLDVSEPYPGTSG